MSRLPHERFSALLLVVSVLLGLGCQKPGALSPIQAGFTVTPATLDFGRVPEGGTKTLTLSVTATSRLNVFVRITTPSPFSSTTTAIDVLSASSVTIPVTMRGVVGAVEKQMVFTSDDSRITVTLRGNVDASQECTPSDPCKVSTYNPTTGNCDEGPAPEGKACELAEVCLEKGRCQSGTCVGSWRTCDDGNVCTKDSCAQGRGCLNVPISCPAPTATCRVAVCDPTRGCGERYADVGTLCGSVSCKEAHVCLPLGVCITTTNTDGFPCAPNVACQPEATCLHQECVIPPKETYKPLWSARLSNPPKDVDAPQLIGDSQSINFAACGLPPPSPDAGPQPQAVGGVGARSRWTSFDVTDNGDGGGDAGEDAGGSDGGSAEDAGVDDAGGDGDGGADGGPGDAGALDAGDGGFGDAGLADGGDGGDVTWCGLVSYTTSGIERFSVPIDERWLGRLIHIVPGGILAQGPDGLRYFSTASGEPAAALRDAGIIPLSPKSIAALDNGVVILGTPDSGIWQWAPDGGTARIAASGLSPTIALDSDGTIFAWSVADQRLDIVAPDDGGWKLDELDFANGPKNDSLTVARGRAVVGHELLIIRDPDGGRHFTRLTAPLTNPFDGGDAAADLNRSAWFERGTVQRAGTIIRYGSVCPAPLATCPSSTRPAWRWATDDTSGDPADNLPLFIDTTDVQLVEVAEVDLGFIAGSAAVARVVVDGGALARVTFIADGGIALSCDLQPNSANVLSASFIANSLYMLVARPDGGFALELYDLGSVSTHSTEWPTAEGYGARRRAQ